jgi:glycerol-3-phosphate acyltransferase PlsY
MGFLEISSFIEGLLQGSLHWAFISGLAVLSYLTGNINPAILLGKIYGIDVRREGSGNAGTTNVLRTMGKKAGVITFVVDVLKGAAPVLLIQIFVSTPAAMCCGVAVIIGHMWPVFHGFRGGKGVATTFGVLLALSPLFALALIGIVIICVLIWRMVSLGVILAAVGGVPLGWLFHPWLAMFIFLVAALIIIKHRENIRRIFAGTESRLSIGGSDNKENSKKEINGGSEKEIEKNSNKDIKEGSEKDIKVKSKEAEKRERKRV